MQPEIRGNGIIDYPAKQEEDVQVPVQAIKDLEKVVDKGFDRLDATIAKIHSDMKWLWVGVFIIVVVSMVLAYRSQASFMTPIGGFEVRPRSATEQGRDRSHYDASDAKRQESNQPEQS